MCGTKRFKSRKWKCEDSPIKDENPEKVFGSDGNKIFENHSGLFFRPGDEGCELPMAIQMFFISLLEILS